MSTTAPFRADIVGSFLRPPRLAEARRRRAADEIDAEALRQVEDTAIADLVRSQVDAGLEVVSDGELRRSWWHLDFWDDFEGVEVVDLAQGRQFHGTRTRPRGIRVAGRIGYASAHPFVESFRHLQTQAQELRVTPKVTIPSPTVFDFRLDDALIDPAAYGRRDDLFDDLVNAYRDALRALYSAGARYVQFDDTAWGYLCSDVEIAKAEARGIRTRGITERYSALINAVIADRPDDLIVTTHVCRGNFRSTWVASGGYEPVADQLLGVTEYDGYFLEYDSDRAGDFEPLRHLPAGRKRVVLGLVTTKSGALEHPDAIKERIDEASAYVQLDQLALSPQCGFASTEEGNLLTDAEQWRKVRTVVSVARDVWG